MLVFPELRTKFGSGRCDVRNGKGQAAGPKYLNTVSATRGGILGPSEGILSSNLPSGTNKDQLNRGVRAHAE